MLWGGRPSSNLLAPICLSRKLALAVKPVHKDGCASYPSCARYQPLLKKITYGPEGMCKTLNKDARHTERFIKFQHNWFILQPNLAKTLVSWTLFVNQYKIYVFKVSSQCTFKILVFRLLFSINLNSKPLKTQPQGTTA